MKKIILVVLLMQAISTCVMAQNADAVTIKTEKVTDNVYFLQGINGFGGGNVVASVGEDGILLVDDMYASMHEKLMSALSALSAKPVRIVLNTHYHGDHIQGNRNFQNNAVIIAHENVPMRLVKTNTEARPTGGMMPSVTFTDSLIVHFNGEDIKLLHFPNSHTDGDAVIYFTKSKLLHLGDMFFFGMFPAVYSEGGGNIRQLVISLEAVSRRVPSDAQVVPGHGNLATMQDLQAYIAMLKETIAAVDAAARAGKTLDQMKAEKILSKYDALGQGGAQTTDQYLAMLYKLLVTEKG